MESYKIIGDGSWMFSSTWDVAEEAQRRCAELELEYSHFEWRPVKVTTEILGKL